MTLVLFLTALLVVSLAGMASVLWLKSYELRTGRVLAASVRPGMRAFFRRWLFVAQRVLPALALGELERAWRVARAGARVGVARALLAAEQGLEHLLNRVRHATTHAPVRGSEASAFLREVAEHKKKLQEGRDDEQPPQG